MTHAGGGFEGSEGSVGDAPAARTSLRVARRALAAALDRLLDEGITDYSARTRASRRRMAALYAGFVEGEELLARLAKRGRGALGADAAVAELVRVTRHLLYWATVDATEDPSAATRAAVAGLRDALRRATGHDGGAHSTLLLDCERCAAAGAEPPPSARGDALCAACARGARRLRAV